MQKTLSFIILFFLAGHLWGQKPDFSGGLTPEITLSRRLAEDFQLTGKIESQHSTVNDKLPGGIDWQYRYESTDLQLFAARSLHPLWKVAGGYQYQISASSANNHRTIQQLSYLQRLEGYRLGHRLRTDQTFYPSAANKYRLRYRLSGELPLQGFMVDPGEYYLVLSNELLVGWQGQARDLENRFALAMGWYLNRAHQLEAGFDYRTDGYLHRIIHHRLWLTLGWYLKL
jgi:hypothetical protein